MCQRDLRQWPDRHLAAAARQAAAGDLLALRELEGPAVGGDRAGGSDPHLCNIDTPLKCRVKSLSFFWGVTMLRKTRLVFASFLLATFFCSDISFSFAEGALAVGLPAAGPRKGFVYGVVWDEKTSAEAQSNALKECQSTKVNAPEAIRACKPIATFRNECANAGFNGDANRPSTAVGWGIGPDPEAANSRAVAMCETMRSGVGYPCHADGEAGCDGSAKPRKE
jgi:hypothetical protein